MKKTIIIILFALVLTASGAFAITSGSTLITTDTSGTTSLASQFSNGLTLGYVKEGSSEVGVIAWSPDWRAGPWGLGLDFNIPLGGDRPNNIQNIVFRYAEYDDGAKGLRYGVLDNVTLGHGLIMSNYTTRNVNYTILNNEQMGLRGFYNWDIYGASAMGTYSHVYYVAAEERVFPRLTLTEYYVTDADGVNIMQTDGTTKLFPAQSGFGVDATVPIVPGWDLYAEAGQLVGHGNAYGAGTGWAFNLLGVASASFSFTYRMLDSGFVPEYFNIEYESNPVDLTSAEAGNTSKNGYLGTFAVNLANRVEGSITYEDYTDTNPALNGLASAILSDQISATGYYSQPNFASFRSVSLEEGAIIGGSVTYKLNPATNVTVHYKKAYNSDLGRVEETQYYEIGIAF
ncbi:MAG: hypothetical protein KKB81_05175 [Candidatus Margulisbacteria bacterium]|nr:hypothetical protein [Candidatus Margulisiibacteriota bacterium]MBU1021349.1 hypothetical protein [Candidatus Margulisiibacteriota bacterium]MBU1729162.1 hypothetical protein [Candidatus Margulisiibacteriota bacterium]MBU1954835.1 hypothetical protein [Candidatus Margulisiibacteriota bacterium]